MQNLTKSFDDFHPLVSIIIPVYNGSNYMREAIDSALSQSYDNIEVIVVNDGSDDDGKTEEIALSYGDKIRYFSKENGHVASALNYGIKKMKGEYFSWLSHDDVYLPNKISYQINQLRELNNKNTILYSGYELINSESSCIGTINLVDSLSKEQLNSSLIPLFRGLIHGCSLLIPSECFAKIGLFDEKLRHTQDYSLWFDFFRQTPVSFCKIPLIKSRVHPEQDSRKLSDSKQECNALWIRLLNSVTQKEMIEAEGSSYAFYKRTEMFLSESSEYNEAIVYAKKLADNEYGKNKVSVVIPVYNRIKFALESIDSAISQTYKNIEIIVINDGSTEDVQPLVAKCKSDDRIIYIKQENKGVSAARNLGIDKSSGEYIAFLDADDTFHPEKIELQLKKMIKDDCYISHTSYNRVNEQGEFISTVKSAYQKGKVFPGILSSCMIATPTVMLRKSLLDNNKFNTSMKYGEDVCLWIDLLYQRNLSASAQPLTSVKFYEESAVNSHSYLIKISSIISHITHNKDYINNKKQLAELFLSVGFYLKKTDKNEENNKQSYRSSIIKFIRGNIFVVIVSKLYRSIQIFGITETIRKLIKKIRIS